MSQLNWTYVSDGGKQYEVGLYHGDKSGHVLVYVNKSLFIIDFSILESKKYSFYLGGELCDLNIISEADRYSYSLKANEKVHSPLNLARKEYFKKYVLWSILLVILFFSLVALITYLTTSML